MLTKVAIPLIPVDARGTAQVAVWLTDVTELNL